MGWAVVIIYAVTITVVVFGLLSLAYGSHLAAPWVPSGRAEREAIAEALPVSETATVYDLGCGNGGVLFALLDRHPGVRAVGCDVAWPPLLVAAFRRLLHRRYRGLRLVWADYFRRQIGEADAVLLYALRRSYPRIMNKFSTELRPDAWVAVERWPFPGLVPAKTLRVPGGHDWFLYRGGQFRTGV